MTWHVFWPRPGVHCPFSAPPSLVCALPAVTVTAYDAQDRCGPHARLRPLSQLEPGTCHANERMKQRTNFRFQHSEPYPFHPIPSLLTKLATQKAQSSHESATISCTNLYCISTSALLGGGPCPPSRRSRRRAQCATALTHPSLSRRGTGPTARGAVPSSSHTD